MLYLQGGRVSIEREHCGIEMVRKWESTPTATIGRPLLTWVGLRGILWNNVSYIAELALTPQCSHTSFEWLVGSSSGGRKDYTNLQWQKIERMINHT